MEVPKRNGGLQTRMTPRKSWKPAMILEAVSLSPRNMAERTMVTTGQANTIHRASGTSIYVTLDSAVVKVSEEAIPNDNIFIGFWEKN